MSLVERKDHDGWAELSLNRPEKLNALSVAMFRSLEDQLHGIAGDPDVRCVVLRGAGRCFSAGHDLQGIHEGEGEVSPGWHSDILTMMERLDTPVIAAVHGHCFTGALEVALACDFIVAADNARFGDTHAKFALTPIWGMSQRLPRRVGIASAKRMMFTADTVGAAEALRIGLVEQVFTLDAFETDIADLARRVAANSPFTHAANKRLLGATDGMPILAGLRWEVLESEGVGDDADDRIGAFLKR